PSIVAAASTRRPTTHRVTTGDEPTHQPSNGMRSKTKGQLDELAFCFRYLDYLEVAAAGSGACALVVLGLVRNECLGGQEQTSNACSVLECATDNLGR